MKIPLSFSIIFFLFGLSGCAMTDVMEVIETSEATHMLNGKAYPATREEQVQVLLEEPKKEYFNLGIVESRGISIWDEGRDLKLSLKALKSEAASIGAHAVIIKSSKQQISSVSAKGTSTERRITGVAIRYK